MNQKTKRRKTMNKKEVEGIEKVIKEIAEMMGFEICLVRDYYNNYRNLTQGTNYYIHSKRKKKS